MTVRELIEALEEMPQDLRVSANGEEITQVLLRDELHLTADLTYEDGPVIKLY